MKKGSAYAKDGTGSSSGANPKRKRTTEGTGPFAERPLAAAPASMAGLSISGGRRWGGGGDLLGGASKDWALPETVSKDIHAAQSWNEAFEDADEDFMPQDKQHQQDKFPIVDERQPTTFGHISVGMASSAMMSTAETVHTVSTDNSRMSSAASAAPSLGATTVSTKFSASTGSSGTISKGSSQMKMGMLPPQPHVPHHPPAGLPPQAWPAPAAASTSGAVPKAVLYTFYGRKPRRKQLANDDYFTWNNGGRPHELRFSGIFQCPLTGECFPSGRQGDPKYYSVEQTANKDGEAVEVVWYTKKTFAEHGAAARCYDCLTYRQALEEGVDPNSIMEGRLGNDAPYKRGEGPALPPMTGNIELAIMANKQRIQSMMSHVEGSGVVASSQQDPAFGFSGQYQQQQQQQQQQHSGQAQAKEPWFVIPQK